MKNHNVWMVLSLMSLTFIAPLGAIEPIIALIAIVISGLLFKVWYFKEMEEQNRRDRK